LAHDVPPFLFQLRYHWRGKGTPSPAQLGLKLVKCLPKKLIKHFKVMILADTAFGSVEFLHGVRQLKYRVLATFGDPGRGKAEGRGQKAEGRRRKK